jgi:hypothetical protein
MRDPKRIYPTTQALADIWLDLPDWRLGQLMYNFQAHMASQGKDIFYMEDVEFVNALRAYVDSFILQ